MTPTVLRAARHNVVVLASATLLSLPALAAPPPPGSDLELRRAQLRNLSEQLQTRLEQRLQCVNKASSLTELESCERRSMHPGMGGWGCPMW
jgi:hypothetical protein